MNPITLTEEQQSAVNRIADWMEFPAATHQEFRLGGYAGTGKTTVIKAVLDYLQKDNRITIAAFTGKAVNVLQRKGLKEAQTLHSLMYQCCPLPSGGFKFILRDELEDNPKLIIVDEASMISNDLYDDLVSFGTKLLFVGDPGQLEPVGDNPDIMGEPDLVLQKIHRQAAESPIITLANGVRLGETIRLGDQGAVFIRNKTGFSIAMAAEFDQVICARNKTRTEINTKFRDMLKKPRTMLLPGDKIIVLRNNPSYVVFNGMILFVETIANQTKDFTLLTAKDEIGRVFPNIPIWNQPFEKDIGKEFKIPTYKTNQMVYADFGYCITCHKSQGSEWPSVLVWDEWMPPKIWDMKRWRYTAITRAAERLTYCL